MAKGAQNQPFTPNVLLGIRSKLGISIPEAASRVGVNRVSWWRWEQGHAPVPPEKHPALRELAGMPGPAARESRNDDTPNDTLVMVPLYSVTAAAGSGIEVGQELADHWIALDRGYCRQGLQTPPEHLVACTVDGDSMEPTVRSGEVIFINQQKAPLRDAIYLIRVDNALMVKRIARRPGGKTVALSDNPSYPAFDLNLTNGECALIGRVVGALRRL